MRITKQVYTALYFFPFFLFHHAAELAEARRERVAAGQSVVQGVWTPAEADAQVYLDSVKQAQRELDTAGLGPQVASAYSAGSPAAAAAVGGGGEVSSKSGSLVSASGAQSHALMQSSKHSAAASSLPGPDGVSQELHKVETAVMSLVEAEAESLGDLD